MTDKELKEKIRAEIERRKKLYYDRYIKKGIGCIEESRYDECVDLLDFINSLPEEPVSEDLEKVSKEYADKNYAEWLDFISGDERDDHYPISEAFKAGARWQASQGVTKKAVIGMATEEILINVSQQTLDALDLCAGDKVIIQIRKEED